MIRLRFIIWSAKNKMINDNSYLYYYDDDDGRKMTRNSFIKFKSRKKIKSGRGWSWTRGLLYEDKFSSSKIKKIKTNDDDDQRDDKNVRV